MKKYIILALILASGVVNAGVVVTGGTGGRISDISSGKNLANLKITPGVFQRVENGPAREKVTVNTANVVNKAVAAGNLRNAMLVYQMGLSEEQNLVQFQAATAKVGSNEWDVRTFQGKATDLTPSMKDALRSSVNSKQWQNVKDLQMQNLGR